MSQLLLDRNEQADAIIETSDGQKVAVNILYFSQYSEFFKCIFYGHANWYVERKQRHIHLTTITAEPLIATIKALQELSAGTEAAICFGEMQLSSMLDILEVAAYLQIEIVLKNVSKLICQKVTTSTLLPLHRKAEKRYPFLADRLWHIIVRDFKVLVKTEIFVELSAFQMVTLLSDSNLNLDPLDEYPTVVKWLKANSNDLEANSSEEFKKLSVAVDRYAARLDMSPYVLMPSLGGLGFHDVPRIPQSVILAIGGWATGGPTSQLEFFELNRQKWMPVQPGSALACPQRRAYHAVVAAADRSTVGKTNWAGDNNNERNCLYIIGGYDGVRHHKSIQKLNLDTLKWSEVAPMNEQRCYVTGATLDDNRILVAGGFNQENRLRSAELFDISRNQWTFVSMMNSVRSDADCVNIGGLIYAVGGFNGALCHSSCEVYDPNTNAWSLLGRHMRHKRSGVKAISMCDNVLVVVGGFTGSVRLKTPEFYDTREGIWHFLADMLNKRSNFGIEMLDNRVIVCGGYNNISTTGMCEEFDWRANRWLPLPEMTFSRSALALVRIDRHPVVQNIVEEYDWTSTNNNNGNNNNNNTSYFEFL